MAVVRPAHGDERDALLALWERSVRATHHFLGEGDICFFRPMVREFLASAMEFWVAAGQGKNAALGFMGLDAESGNGCKLEALFIDPAHAGKGIGSQLVRHARMLKGALVLDVNEQNPGALAFYRRLGFTVTGRSPYDGSGRPFPLLHMKG